MENYHLRSDQFDRNIRTNWQELQFEKDLCDVTLACDDKQIKSHKIVISSCSPVFKNILKQNSHQHPLIYLRGVKHTDLRNLLTFIYQGEVNLADKDLESFLETAKDLKILGLPETYGQGAKPNLELPQNIAFNESECEQKEKYVTLFSNEKDEHPPITNIKQSRKYKTLIPNDKIDVDLDLDEPPSKRNFKKEKNIMENTDIYDNLETVITSENIIQYQEENNISTIEKFSYEKQFSCDRCGNQFKSKQNLQVHAKSIHEGVHYSCDQCSDKLFKDHTTLRRHKASVHEGVRYPCDLCDYKARRKAHLRRHFESSHH